MDAILTALGLQKGAVIGGFLGAVISLKFIERLSLVQRATTVLCGTFVAAYCTPLTVAVFELSPKTEGAIAFIGGLFGMSIAGAVIKAMPELIDAARNRIGGSE